MPGGTPAPARAAMRASAFRALLQAGVRIAQRMTAEDETSALGADIEALGAIVDRLAPYARARGGGVLELDIAAYQGEGGGGLPAFLRDEAMALLNVATILQRAREAYWALDEEVDEAPHQGPREGGDEANERGADEAGAGRARRLSRPDLRFARTARTAYTADEVRKLQRLFRFLHSRRAYAKLKQGGIYRRALSEGRIWGERQSIVGLSRANLRHLRRTLLRLSDDERALHARLHALPFRLKHATTAQARAAIANVGMLWSLDSLLDWYVPGASGFTTRADLREKMDVDFVFFRIEVGEAPMATRYGEVQFVFTLEQVLEDGWVSLHDMLAPIASDTLRNLRRREDGTLVRRSRYLDDDNDGGAWWKLRWQHEVCDPAGRGGAVRIVHILDEVFYGPDILEGLVLAILRDLRELPSLQDEAVRHMDEPAYLAWLVGALYRVEAKHPSAFRFDAETLVREHRKPAIDPRALKAAT